MRIRFLGANRQVTGSRYLLEAGGLRLMIDCGLFQERAFLGRNWEDSPVPPDSIDCLLATHAHLDHVGLIPRLVAQGYRNPILTVEPSVDLAEIVLRDAGHIQEEEAETKRRRHAKENRRGPHPLVPLYTQEEAKEAASLFRGVEFGERVELGGKVAVTFRGAGHILGSASVLVEAEEGGRARRVLFSGDLGQWESPIIPPPEEMEAGADYVILESTYGGRNHHQTAPVRDQVAEAVQAAARRGGNLIIPTFAMERAQELVYCLGGLLRENRIPQVPVFVDSPMATDVTQVFRTHCRYLKEDIRCEIEGGAGLFQFPGLRFIRDAEESKKLNEFKGPGIIMSPSGMCTGGRIKHHLKANIGRPESTVLFVGYQGEGTLGRQILDRNPEVRIHGASRPVRAEVRQIHGISAHGDQEDLLRWLEGRRPAPRQVFLTHGEESASRALGGAIRERFGWPAAVPAYGEAHELA
ncbi:MAG: MBL fold metallo-hydrolase [Candidatus Tectomicrobia bacterium]|nr:MBL fold metallo-hydrolase [Candidatus Tectomicrobia bacterium]